MLFSLQSRLGIAGLLLVSQLAVILSGTAYDSIALLLSGVFGCLLAVGVAALFAVDYKYLKGRAKVTEDNAAQIKALTEAMGALEQRLGNQN